jgi:hypothetical protein
MQWTGEGLIIGARRHGESSVIVEVMVEGRGRHLGLVRGGRSAKYAAALQAGNSVQLTWRARQVNCTELPGCSVAAWRRERPPRTRPRWRPRPITIASAMMLVSPKRRTPISRPSPVHSMQRGHAFPRGNSRPISR